MGGARDYRLRVREREIVIEVAPAEVADYLKIRWMPTQDIEVAA